MNTNTIIAASNFPLCDDLFRHILSYLSPQERQKIVLLIKYGKCYSRIHVAVCKNIYLNHHFIAGSTYKRYERISYYDKNLNFIKDKYVVQPRYTRMIVKRTKCFVTIQYQNKNKRYKIRKTYREHTDNNDYPHQYRNDFTRFVGNIFRLQKYRSIQRQISLQVNT